MMDHTQIIEDTLRQLGVGGNYISQQRAVTALQLTIEDEDRLLYVTKNIYLPVAQICGCKWTAVERNLRTVVQRVWRINPEGLAQMAGYPLREPPTASDFIENLAYYTRRSLPTPTASLDQPGAQFTPFSGNLY